MTAYLDESGTHDGSPLTVMAGWVGYADRWREFDRRWNALLRRPLPYRGSITHIHGKHLRQGSKQFRGWPVEDRRQLAKSASEMAQEHSIFSISVLLNKSDYERIYIGTDRALRRHRAAIDSTYGVCFRVFLSLVTRIPVVMEAGHSNGGAAEEIFAGY